jgi:hypothetical protein
MHGFGPQDPAFPGGTQQRPPPPADAQLSLTRAPWQSDHGSGLLNWGSTTRRLEREGDTCILHRARPSPRSCIERRLYLVGIGKSRPRSAIVCSPGSRNDSSRDRRTCIRRSTQSLHSSAPASSPNRRPSRRDRTCSRRCIRWARRSRPSRAARSTRLLRGPHSCGGAPDQRRRRMRKPPAEGHRSHRPTPTRRLRLRRKPCPGRRRYCCMPGTFRERREP